MKLRIRGNSLRLRLTRGEVAELAERGRVDDGIAFGGRPAARLGYALVMRDEARDEARDDGGDDARVLSARFDAGAIVVTVSAKAARAWAASDDVGLEAEQPIDGGETLRLLVEKDFACLQPRKGEDDRDAFANPSSGSTC